MEIDTYKELRGRVDNMQKIQSREFDVVSFEFSNDCDFMSLIGCQLTDTKPQILDDEQGSLSVEVTDDCTRTGHKR